jgi:DNA-binding response OmpR family regulator
MRQPEYLGKTVNLQRSWLTEAVCCRAEVVRARGSLRTTIRWLLASHCPTVAASGIDVTLLSMGASSSGRFLRTDMLKRHIVVVDDEPDLCDALRDYLTRYGYRVTALSDGGALRALAGTERFDLAILDVNMPGEDGFSLARWLRSRSQAGIIFASANGQPIDRIVGLEVGGDDYVVKPFDLRELLARVRSVLRRVRSEAPEEAASELPAKAGAGERQTLRFGGWVLDPGQARLTGPDSKPVELTAGEFKLLELLASSAGRVVSRERILACVSSSEPESARAVDIRIARLRRKIEPDPENPRYLITVRGEGYQLVPDGA